jgi:hypothetical protein
MVSCSVVGAADDNTRLPVVLCVDCCYTCFWLFPSVKWADIAKSIMESAVPFTLAQEGELIYVLCCGR